MPYDAITVKLRVPPRFNDYAFTEAMHRLLWDKLGCDRAQTGVLTRQIEPAIVDGKSPFVANNAQFLIRIEARKLTAQKVWDSVQKYLTQNAGFTIDEGYVRDVDIKNDVERTEL